jgi:endogenous inhibitor of DNA gyrase (YacG/DUF329 family)
MSDPAQPDSEAKRRKPCPICGRPTIAEFHPFCSKRCRNVDLNRWLGGAYAIPGDPAPSDEEEPG